LSASPDRICGLSLLYDPGLKICFNNPRATVLQDGLKGMVYLQEVATIREIVTDTLGLGERGAGLTAESPLLGAIPELDSMAVINLITALEEHYGFSIADDEISADVFQTLGSLAALVGRKLG
jgi:acyl carrier protein